MHMISKRRLKGKYMLNEERPLHQAQETKRCSLEFKHPQNLMPMSLYYTSLYRLVIADGLKLICA